MKTIRVSGWLEVKPPRGEKIRIAHLITSSGKRVCRCGYIQGYSAVETRPSTREFESMLMGQDENGQIYLETEKGETVRIRLCDKSYSTLRQEIDALKKFQGGTI